MTQALAAPGVLADIGSDEALAVAAREAPAEFAALYERYARRVYRYLVTRLKEPPSACGWTRRRSSH